MRTILNLRQIETFRAVMVSGSIVGAARLMNVTQPGVSRTIGMLEDRLGYALFLRQGRRIVPTPEGDALYREVEKSYRSIEAISQIALDIGMQRAGALRIATLPALSQSVVPNAIGRFLADRPAVTTFVHSLPTLQIADLVSSGQFDIGIVEKPVLRPAIQVEDLGSMPAVVLLPAGHALAGQASISVRDLAHERMILLSQNSFTRYHIEDAFSAAGVSPVVVAETPNSLMACALVASGGGLTIATQSTAESFLTKGLVARPLAEAVISRYAMIFPLLGQRSKLVDAFVTELVGAFEHATSTMD